MRKRTYQKIIIIVSEKMRVRLIRFQRERIENPANAYAGRFLQEKRVPNKYLAVG